MASWSKGRSNYDHSMGLVQQMNHWQHLSNLYNDLEYKIIRTINDYIVPDTTYPVESHG